jgi:hypothetical protein
MKSANVNWALACYLTSPTRFRIGVYNFATAPASTFAFFISHFNFFNTNLSHHAQQPTASAKNLK